MFGFFSIITLRPDTSRQKLGGKFKPKSSCVMAKDDLILTHGFPKSQDPGPF